MEETAFCVFASRGEYVTSVRKEGRFATSYPLSRQRRGGIADMARKKGPPVCSPGQRLNRFATPTVSN